MSNIAFVHDQKYKIQVKGGTDEGIDFNVLQSYPLEQEGQHCFDMVHCDCACCFPNIIDLRDEEGRGDVIVEHKWIQ